MKETGSYSICFVIFLIQVLSLLISSSANEIESGSGIVPRCLTMEESLSKKCSNAEEFYKLKNESSGNMGLQWDIDWSNIVVMMIIHEDSQVDTLIKAHFDTWLKNVDEGLDLVFITDASDIRSDSEILPDAESILPTTTIYRSPATPDGKHIRFKVRDAYRQMGVLYHNNFQKKYFIKIDVDTFVLPENLLSYIKKLNSFTSEQPLLFGKAVCSPEKLCYAGGALYGMNRIGLSFINQFFVSNPNVHEEEHFSRNRKQKVNFMLHEDYMVSYSYWAATGYPVVSNDKIFNYHLQREGFGTELSPPICYHQVKHYFGIHEYYKLFYDRKEKKLKPLSKVENIWKNQEKMPQNFPFLTSSAFS